MRRDVRVGLRARCGAIVACAKRRANALHHGIARATVRR
jgi:hypothetical protein